MYSYNSFGPKEKHGAFPPPSPSFSTAVTTPVNEEEVAAARNFLRSVISSTRTSPRLTMSADLTEASVPPLPQVKECRGTQTDSLMPPTSLEGLIRAAGFSLANFATELKTLERRLDSQHGDVLRELKSINASKKAS